MFHTTVRVACCALLLCAGAAQAQTGFNPCPSVLSTEGAPAPEHPNELEFSPDLTHHWNYSPEHRPVDLIGYTRYQPGNTFCGASFFTNSFGQPTVYAYVGKTWPGIWRSLPALSVSVSAGILYGYVGQYQHKVPLNYHGFSPAIIPDVGYSFTKQDSLHLYVLGNSALMLGYSHRY